MRRLNQERNFWTFLLLSIVTCGIYEIYFMYHLVNDLNTLGEGDGQESPNYIVVLLLSIVTCSIYMFYWYYKQGNRIKALGDRNGVAVQEDGTAILLWALVGSLICGIGMWVALYKFVTNMNNLCAAYNAGNHV